MRISDWSSDVCSSDLKNVCGGIDLATMANPIFGHQAKFGGNMTIRFNIPGMTCGGCARSITKAIQGIDTQAKVETDIPERLVSVETSADIASLSAALRDRKSTRLNSSH